MGGGYCPSIHDIAVGLSRIPRWAGATVRPWSVLLHSLAAYDVAYAQDEKPEVIFAALMHDAEEMATGDIPSPFKTEAQKNLADELRGWFFDVSFKQPYPLPSVWERVHEIDRALAAAEAQCLCHPMTRRDFPDWTQLAVDSVWDLIGMEEREAVQQFERRASHLLSLAPMRALSRRVS